MLNISQSPSVCVHQSMNNEWQSVIKLSLICNSLMQLSSDALFCWENLNFRNRQHEFPSDDNHKISRFLFAENLRGKEGRHPNQGIIFDVYNWKQRWALLFLIMEWVEYTDNIMLQNKAWFHYPLPKKERIVFINLLYSTCFLQVAINLAVS